MNLDPHLDMLADVIVELAARKIEREVASVRPGASPKNDDAAPGTSQGGAGYTIAEGATDDHYISR